MKGVYRNPPYYSKRSSNLTSTMHHWTQFLLRWLHKVIICCVAHTIVMFWMLFLHSFSHPVLSDLLHVLCGSDKCKPKYTRNLRKPNTRMHIRTYVYTVYARMPDKYVWAKVLFLLFLTGHCCFQWLDSLAQSERDFYLYWIRIYKIRAYAFRWD